MWIQVWIGHSGVYKGHYRDVKRRLFVSYTSYLVLLKVIFIIHNSLLLVTPDRPEVQSMK